MIFQLPILAVRLTLILKFLKSPKSHTNKDTENPTVILQKMIQKVTQKSSDTEMNFPKSPTQKVGYSHTLLILLVFD